MLPNKLRPDAAGLELFGGAPMNRGILFLCTGNAYRSLMKETS